MTDDRANNRQDLPKQAEGPEPPAPDERDAIIERLERALAEEREHSATLRKTVEDLRFKAGILETSYSTQLEDARLRSDTAEGELADLRNRMTTLESAHEEAMRLLAEARAELDKRPTQPGRLRKALASSDALQIDAIGQDAPESRLEEGSGTINKLMSDPRWATEEQPADDEEQPAEAQETPEQDSPTEELIAPELVFTVEGDDKA